ncbi:MAG: hypothetical protein M3T96_04415 [Acidobacteriota bacterium]|nr:hypothetical protein [Acidobacteriota bacterium]
MKKFAFLFLLILLSQTAFAQRPRSRPAKKSHLAAKGAGSEKTDLDNAVAQTDKVRRINALRKFAADFPNSTEKNRVVELIVSTLAALADEKIQAGGTADGIELFKSAIAAAPLPVSDKLFTEILLQIPNSLFLRGQTAAAVETARLIETKADGNARQTLALAAFYLNLENAAEAERLAKKSIALEPNLPAAYQTLGLAERINFNLENAVNAYQKALELDANSIASKRGLAEMKRAVGKPSEAVALYREILAKDDTDGAARAGLILALFDDEKRAEAESEMQQTLAANAKNLPLLVGAAYWYAAHDNGTQAVDLAEKAIAVEPRYTWAYIALARGLTTQKRLPDAEKTLLTARKYGNFPTLEYELAAVRMQSGFYREAVEGLTRSFRIKDGLIETKLGGRVSAEAGDFIELLSLERRASIFEPLTADDGENAGRLKSLLDFYQTTAATPNDATLNAKADEFIGGADKMKLHRQLFVANRLLSRKLDLPKVLELTREAVGGIDAGLNVENPAAAVLAEELYDSRQTAIFRGELIIVPDVARQTLSNILRGRIEDLAGWALFQQNKSAEAAVRLKRAVSILPEKSSLWRDAEWRLGTALEADDKLKDALDTYVKSYTNGAPSAFRYSVVQSVYQRVNGSTDGLEDRIGAKPNSTAPDVYAQNDAPPPLIESPVIAPDAVKVEPTTEVVIDTTAAATPAPQPETKPVPETAQIEPPIVKNELVPLPEVKEESASSSAIKQEVNPPKVEVKVSNTLPTETKSAVKSAPRETTPPTGERNNAANAAAAAMPLQKPLFEPVIITVPKTEVDSTKILAESNGGNRQRVAVEKVPEPPVKPCEIRVNQETASVLSDGGSLALITELIGDGAITDINATSSSPSDVDVLFDSEISGQTKRSLYIVKSISQKQGVFTIGFELPCGRKNVSVNVR